MVAGLAVISDWLGSNVEFFPYADGPRDLESYYEVARARAWYALDQAGLLPSRVRPAPAGMRALFPTCSPTATQQSVETLPATEEPELLIVEEPSGSGKTEAALAWAHRKLAAGAGDGIYIALPTMATASAMHDRVEPLMTRLFDDGERPSLALAHSAERLARWLASSSPSDRDYSSTEQTATNLSSAWLSDSGKKALLASVGVGTIDQALVSVLPVPYGALRLAGVARKVLVVDELHASDGHTAQLLETLLEFQAALGGSAVLLSTALPRAMRQRFLDAFARGTGRSVDHHRAESRYPLVSHYGKSRAPSYVSPACRTPRSVHITLCSDQDDVIERLLDTAGDGRCACWIRNSVSDAVAAFAALRERKGADVTLFHARFALGHRLDLEGEVVRRYGKDSGQADRAGTIVVATQVVEQSLDLDFDFVVSDLAPVDLLIQRAGRVRRHPRDAAGNPATTEGRSEANLVVYGPQPGEDPAEDWVRSVLPKTALVYPDHGRLWLSAKTLQDHGTIGIPGCARELVEAVYGDSAERVIPMALLRASQKAQSTTGAGRTEADLRALRVRDGYRVTLGQWRDDASTPTRLGLPTVQVRLAKPAPSGGGIEPLVGQGTFGWQLSQVPVPTHWLAKSPQPEWEQRVESGEQAMPDGGRYSMTILLEPRAGGWRARVCDAKNHLWSWSYEPHVGLTRVAGLLS
jgi:CRISPR-associated endonuclease/helicase Cas3